MAFILRNRDTEKPIQTGDPARTFRGEWVTVEGFVPPQHAGSSGRIIVHFDSDPHKTAREFYPSVIGAEIVEV